MLEVGSSNFVFDGAHTLVYLADIIVERSKTDAAGYEGFAIDFPAQDVYVVPEGYDLKAMPSTAASHRNDAIAAWRRVVGPRGAALRFLLGTWPQVTDCQWSTRCRAMQPIQSWVSQHLSARSVKGCFRSYDG